MPDVVIHGDDIEDTPTEESEHAAAVSEGAAAAHAVQAGGEAQAAGAAATLADQAATVSATAANVAEESAAVAEQSAVVSAAVAAAMVEAIQHQTAQITSLIEEMRAQKTATPVPDSTPTPRTPDRPPATKKRKGAWYYGR